MTCRSVDWTHAAPTEASVYPGNATLSLAPRLAAGKPSAQATACGLEAEASTPQFALSDRLFWVVLK